MAFPSTLSIKDFAALSVKKFVRTLSTTTSELTYVGLASLGSISVMVDTIRIRASTRGTAKIPHLQKKSFNVQRSLSIRGADGNPYDITVNLTIVTPGGNVISGTVVKGAIHDVLAIVTDCEALSNEDEGAGHVATISQTFSTAALVLQLD